MGFSDFIRGKEKTYAADPVAKTFTRVGKQGGQFALSGLNELKRLQGDTQNAVASQIGRENNLIRGASEDAARRTSQLVAQRGLGNSSIGLGQEISGFQQLKDKLAENNASAYDRLRAMATDNLNIGKGLMALRASAGPIQMQSIKQRQGGFGQLLGTAAGAGLGAYFGGPKGAATGAQIGSSLGGAAQNY